MGRKSTKACLLYLSYKQVPFPFSVSLPYGWQKMSIKKWTPYFFSIYIQDVGYKFLGRLSKKWDVKVVACGYRTFGT